MLSTLQRTERKHTYNRREHERIESNPLAETKKLAKYKRSRVEFYSIRKKICNQRTGIASSSLVTGTFQTTYLRKTNGFFNRSPSARTTY